MSLTYPAQRALSNDIQEFLNAGHRAGTLTKATLLLMAGLMHINHPQYKGYWDNHELFEMPYDLKTKAGQSFKKGDITLMKIETDGHFKNRQFAYSFRTGVDTLI